MEPKKKSSSNDEIENFVLEKLAFTTKAENFVEKIKSLGIEKALWSLPFGTACCSLEFLSVSGPRYDVEQHGIKFDQFAPEQSDLLIVGGTVTEKLAPILKNIYDKMNSPKWVIAMGACASSGGPYRAYHVVQGISEIIPVDVYIPGCPPTPEALVQGIHLIMERVQKGISSENVQYR